MAEISRRRPEEITDRHEREILANREAWKRKPSLRACYREFHRKIRDRIKSIPGKLIVELGSGMGSIKETIPDCLTTDLFPNPWLDRQENAYCLSFSDESVGNLILFDVWHHLEYPGTALAEFARVLAPGGRLILFEPSMSLVGKIVYGLCHPEPIALNGPIAWEAPEGFEPASAPYFAAQARAHRIFLKKQKTDWKKAWVMVSAEEICSFAYLMSGGFSGRQLYPDGLQAPIAAVDRALTRFPSAFAARILIALEKKPADA